MTEELQRVTIARECGWKDVELRLYNEGAGMDAHIWTSGIIGRGGREIPDYLWDLNAANLMEMSLSDKSPGKDKDGNALPSDRARYRVMLCLITMNQGGPISATAAKRAEAFLRTVSKWEGAPL